MTVRISLHQSPPSSTSTNGCLHFSSRRGFFHNLGSRDSSVVIQHRTRDRKVAGSSPGRSGGRIFFSKVNFLCRLVFRYPFHLRVSALARKRSRSFCQKCMREDTAKHACTLRIWLCTKWRDIVHGCMVYTELAVTTSVSCGTSHVTTKQRCQYTHHLGGYSKRAIKSDSHSFGMTCDKKRSRTARERRRALYKSNHQLKR